MPTFSQGVDMEYFCTARTILGITARAWAIPLKYGLIATGIRAISYGRFDPCNRRIELED